MLVKSFIGEARDLLESVVRSILELEADPTSTDLLNEIFRAAHTLKGSAGVVGLAAIQDIAHALEDLLERLRSGATTASPETIDVLLAGFDAIKVLVEALERGEDVSAPPELVVRIKNLSAAPAAVECASPDPILRGPDAEGLERLPHAARCNILRYLESKTRVYQIVVEPDARVFFFGLDPLRAWREAMDMGTLIHFELHADKVPALRDLNPEMCYLGFSGYLAGDIDRTELEEVFVFLASETSRVRIHEIAWHDLIYDYEACPRASWERTPVLEDFLGEVTAALAELKVALPVSAGEPEPAFWEKVRSLLETIKHITRVFVGIVPRHSLPYHAATNLHVIACLLKYRLQAPPPGAETVDLLRDTVEVFEAHVAGLRAGTYPDLDMPGILDDLLRWVPASGEDEGTLVLDELTGTVFLSLLDQQKAYLACQRTPAELSGCALAVCRILQ
ncbi:MAG: Hpt domain-containing protein [Desulfotomaculales bacterium]